MPGVPAVRESGFLSHIQVTGPRLPVAAESGAMADDDGTTARSCGWPCPRSWPWWPSRSSCSATPRWSATSGPSELAGLGIAGAVLQTAVGLCVFLAYGTTAGVARSLGAGDLRAALARASTASGSPRSSGIVLTVAGMAAGRPAGRPVRASPAVADQAATYLRAPSSA